MQLQSYNISHMEFTLLVCGHPAVGKTCFLNRMFTGEFSSQRKHPHAVSLHTNYGTVILHIQEQNHYIEECDSETTKSFHDAEIIMYDVQRPETQNIIGQIPSTLKPRIIVGNKADNRAGPFVSAKWNYNLEMPFLYILQRLVAMDIRLVEAPAIVPVTVQIQPTVVDIFKHLGGR